MRIRYVASGLLLLAAFALLGHVSASSEPSAAPLIYTVAKKYDALAWMHGQDRFPQGAQLFVQADGKRHALVSGFAASADPAVSFDGTQVLFAGKQKAADHWQIYSVGVNGKEPHRITSCADDCIRPLYLPEGRIVYARKAEGRFAIETAHVAGGPTLALTYSPANSLPTDVLRDGRVLFTTAIPSDRGDVAEIYTVYSDGSGVESYRCDHGHPRHSGHQIDSGDIVFASERGLARFTSALADEATVQAPSGEYAGDVAQTSSGDWLLASRPDLHSAFQIKHWKPGSSSLQSVAVDPENNLIQPVVVRPRPVPNRHPSALHDWSYANVLCLNAYTSKYSFAEGSVASVRLHTQDRAGNEKLLGTATVESDGSFYLRTPADQPLKIELLDRAGKTLKKEAGWFWLRRGEQRICVGCHAGPETSPENAVPAVLTGSTIPADMTGAPVASKGGH